MNPIYKNISFYIFFKLSDNLPEAKTILLQKMIELNVKGTIIMAPEGVNASLCALEAEMDRFLALLFAQLNIPQTELKVSYSKEMSFKRSMVKVKPWIVAPPGKMPIDVSKETAPRITPEELHQWIKDNKEMIVLDTRNDYEYDLGRFQNAVHLGTKHFADFEDDLQKAPDQWQNKPVVTFCTGGIRCEKAAVLMLKKGFKEVYQLDGGILNYFKKVGRGYFEGDCFVFDERIALNEELNPKEDS